MQSKLKAGKSFIRRYCADVSGASAVEYGLIVAVLSVALIASYKIIAVNENSLWNSVSDNLEATNTPEP